MYSVGTVDAAAEEEKVAEEKEADPAGFAAAPRSFSADRERDSDDDDDDDGDEYELTALQRQKSREEEEKARDKVR